MRSSRHSLACLIAVCLAVRIVLWLSYQPMWDPDAAGYLSLANHISSWDFTTYDHGRTGGRTPGYPMFMAAVGSSLTGIWIGQGVLGIATAVVLFVLARRHGRGPLESLLVGLLPTLSMNLVSFEAYPMSETLAMFLAAATLLAYDHVVRRPEATWSALLLGLIAALLVLTRPQFLFVCVLLFVALVVQVGRRHRKTVVAFTLAATLPLASWMQFQKVKTGEFGMGSLVGYSLSNIVGGIMERAPERFAAERDVYLRYRAVTVAKTGSWVCTIFDAVDDMKAVTGLSDLGLSHRLSELSLDLIRRNPALYVKNFVRQVAYFWSSPIAWDLDAFRSRPVAIVLNVEWKLVRPVLVAMNAFFLAGCAMVAWRIVRRRPHATLWSGASGTLIVGALLALGSCFSQALVERETAGRYAFPTQPIVEALVVLAALAILDARRARLGTAAVETTATDLGLSR